MDAQAFQEALHTRTPVFGTLVVSTSPETVPVIAAMGIDYVFIDTEHIAIDRRTLSWMCRAYSAAGVMPMVRIPSPSPDEASQAIDAGAQAILAPYIETVAQVEALVGAVKYKPLKGAFLKEMIEEASSHPAQRQYATSLSCTQSLLINVESVPALERIEQLIAVPGLDGLIIGPHDLSVSLGIPEEWTNPRFIATVEKIFKTAALHNMSAGIHHIFDGQLEQYERWHTAGANIILHSADLLSFVFSMRRELTIIRNMWNERGTTPDREV